ncbi:MAG: hypothetical protein M1819_006776 [Sarea resinae]|nr:MAG: hypothetical protein M1819_006776 [Sarea resinae]
MGFINIRELLQFPAGDNSSDTLINGVHFNSTALNYYNYTYFSNGTISNSSKCYLVFDQYQPVMFPNGSFVNGTSCYSPVNGIHTRSILGIVFGCLYAFTILFSLVNLRKHGRLFLPQEKRFRPVGRRWQWYWLIFVAASGIISGITSVDVDRDYLQSIAIILQSFFYCLMMPPLLAAVWESARHWCSWQERQIYDRDPFLLPQDDVRGKKEFYMPLIFYLFAWLDFFLTVPRSWTDIERQRSPQQQNADAKPAATDGRFKAAAFMEIAAWVMICWAVQHGVHYYKPRNRGCWNSFNGFCHYAPTKIVLSLAVLAIKIVYDIVSAFHFSVSPFKYNVEAGWIYGLGYAPILLIMIILEVAGYVEENEDRKLIEQRKERGRSIDAELGLVKKPGWWSKMHGDQQYANTEQRLRDLTTEVGGGPPTTRNLAQALELGTLEPYAQERIDDPFSDDAPYPYRPSKMSDATTQRETDSIMTDDSRTLHSTMTPIKVRSMLDI